VQALTNEAADMRHLRVTGHIGPVSRQKQFRVFAVCQPDALSRFVEGFAMTVRVRLIHAQVRRLLLESGTGLLNHWWISCPKMIRTIDDRPVGLNAYMIFCLSGESVPVIGIGLISGITGSVHCERHFCHGRRRPGFSRPYYGGEIRTEAETENCA
jgi:hypothetical protein